MPELVIKCLGQVRAPIPNQLVLHGIVTLSCRLPLLPHLLNLTDRVTDIHLIIGIL
jgi:hypothetical protein